MLNWVTFLTFLVWIYRIVHYCSQIASFLCSLSSLWFPRPRQPASLGASPSQVGSIPDQCPVAPQVSTTEPLSVHLSGHANVHSVPSTGSPLQLMLSFPEMSKCEHRTAENDRIRVAVKKNLLEDFQNWQKVTSKSKYYIVFSMEEIRIESFGGNLQSW